MKMKTKHVQAYGTYEGSFKRQLYRFKDLYENTGEILNCATKIY